MVSVKDCADRILGLFNETAERKGVGEIPVTTLYETLLKEAPHDIVQRAIQYLVDRDFIAPHTYSLTAKGRKKSIQT